MCTSHKQVIQEHLLLMDGRRPRNYFEGPYPSAQKKISRQQSMKYTLRTGSTIWGNKNWASLLEYVDYLHFTISGTDKKLELNQMGKAVDELRLTYRDKIRFVYNHTHHRRVLSKLGKDAKES